MTNQFALLDTELPTATEVIATDRTSEKLGTRFQVVLSVLSFTLTFLAAALLPLVIPAQITVMTPGSIGNTHQAALLGVLAAVSGIATLVVQPFIGVASDRCTSRLGRRRPYIIGSTVALLIGLGMLTFTHSLVLYSIALFIAMAGQTSAFAAYQGLVPDLVPTWQRGSVSGWMGLMTILGTVGSLAVAAVLLGSGSTGMAAAQAITHGATLYYGISAALVVAGTLITLVGVKELPIARPAPTAEAGERPRLATRAYRMWCLPWTNRNFTWVFLTRSFVFLGLSLFMTYIEYYFAQVDHLANSIGATASNAVMALLGAILSSILLGILSDRMKRRVPIVCIATAFMAMTSVAFVFMPANVPLWPFGVIFGIGYGAYASVDSALAVDALPSLAEAGKDLGILSIAATLPSVLAPVVGSVVIVLGTHLIGISLSYRLVFAIAGLFVVLGAVFVLKVSETTPDTEDGAAGTAEVAPLTVPQHP